MDPPYPTRSCQLLGRYLAIFHSPRFTSSNRMASRCMIWWKAGTWCTTSLINTRNWACGFWENISVFFVWIWLMKYWTYSNFKQSNVHSHLCLFVQVLTKWDAADGWWFVSPLILSADGGRWTTKLVNPWESVMFEPQLKITFFRL